LRYTLFIWFDLDAELPARRLCLPAA